MLRSLVGSEMCIRDRYQRRVRGNSGSMSQSIKVWTKPETLSELRAKETALQKQLEEIQGKIKSLDQGLTVPKTTAAATLLCGATAGCCEILATMPLDVIKTRMQVTKYPSVLSCARDVVSHGGVTGLYKGMPAMLFQVGGKVGLRFTAFDQIKRLFRDDKGRLSSYLPPPPSP
eukprot:TRINITY_DN6780_c0_g1_i1.p2 TRINITY_DN6780_c0_g1~~TRINITY_DN6780_c0_g1_i1.p2  ORF type:complete len:174 (+),score=51.10 TRINITY_DN6780_c0_g1_i1:135-656(+)